MNPQNHETLATMTTSSKHQLMQKSLAAFPKKLTGLSDATVDSLVKVSVDLSSIPNVKSVINPAAWACVYLADVLYQDNPKIKNCIKKLVHARYSNQSVDMESDFYGCSESCLRCDVCYFKYLLNREFDWYIT